jgi:hypothetical protein
VLETHANEIAAVIRDFLTADRPIAMRAIVLEKFGDLDGLVYKP